MTAGLAGILGALAGLGVLLIIVGLRHGEAREPGPRLGQLAARVRQQATMPRLTGTVVTAAVVAAVTRWPAGTVLAGLAAWFLPRVLGPDREHARALEQIEAIASFTEMLRDTISAAAGLEQAILAAEPVAPAPIREQVVLLAARIRRGQRLPAALRAFAAEIADPTADLVVAALLLAAEQQARDLAHLLGSLADSARQHAVMRMRVAAGRARVRTAARIIIAVTLLLVVGLLVWSRAFLQPYGTAAGQLMLLAVGACFSAGFWWLHKISVMDSDPRILTNLAGVTPADADGGTGVTAALLAGAGFGLGLLAIAAGLAPRRASLADALDFLTRQRPAPVITLDAGGWAARLGRPAAALLAGLGLPGKTLRADLAILGRPPERLLAEQATAAVAGLLLLPAMTGLLALAGVPLGWQLPAGGAVVLAVAGFAAPALAVRQEAAARRAGARHALAAFLDLVVIAIAGGAGVEAALTYAAATGQGLAFGQLRQALETARLTRQPPWATLGQLGTELGVTELTELAASITLAGTEGAKVRASLAAKSAAMRARQLAEAEAGAQAATERMSLPLVVLFAGFLALIGYPAIVHVINGI